jgi:N-acylneuraminate cytidylyltransferase
MKHTAFIFARGGSKGVKGKNLRDLEGKSLLQRAIETALEAPEIERVIVSTDSEEIAEKSLFHGAEVPFMRPKHLATDESPELLSWKHALEQLMQIEGAMPERLVSIPTTAPLRIAEDISGCIRVFEETNADLTIVTSQAGHNPYFNMVEVNGQQSIQVPMLASHPATRRQDSPLVHDITTVTYVAKSSYVLACKNLFQGKVQHFEVPTERAIDIDSELDLQIAGFLLRNRQRES